MCVEAGDNCLAIGVARVFTLPEIHTVGGAPTDADAGDSSCAAEKHDAKGLSGGEQETTTAGIVGDRAGSAGEIDATVSRWHHCGATESGDRKLVENDGNERGIETIAGDEFETAKETFVADADEIEAALRVEARGCNGRDHTLTKHFKRRVGKESVE